MDLGRRFWRSTGFQEGNERSPVERDVSQLCGGWGCRPWRSAYSLSVVRSRLVRRYRYVVRASETGLGLSPAGSRTVHGRHPGYTVPHHLEPPPLSRCCVVDWRSQPDENFHHGRARRKPRVQFFKSVRIFSLSSSRVGDLFRLPDFPLPGVGGVTACEPLFHAGRGSKPDVASRIWIGREGRWAFSRTIKVVCLDSQFWCCRRYAPTVAQPEAETSRGHKATGAHLNVGVVTDSTATSTRASRVGIISQCVWMKHGSAWAAGNLKLKFDAGLDCM